MVLAAEVYAKKLSYLGYGFPLWIPEPSEYGEVQVGDVGYVLNGCFYRMFNVMRPEGDLMNQWGVPTSFELLDKVSKLLDPGALCSRSVRKTEIEIEAQTNVAPIGAGYRFTCTQSQGALLILNGDASSEEVHPDNASFSAYMRKHHSSWCEFALEQYNLALKPEGIVLVRGWVKTSDWAAAAFLDKGTTHQLTFQADAATFANARVTASLSDTTSVSVQHRTGKSTNQESPGDPQTTRVKDQCVFLSVYKMKKSLYPFPLHKIVASAEPNDEEHEDPDQGSGGIGITAEDVHIHPAIEKVLDPLDDVLDYILETSEAETALASHSALKLLPQEWLVDDDAFLDTLRANKPPVVVDAAKVGMLQIEVSMGHSQASPPIETASPQIRSPSRTHYPPSRTSPRPRPRSRSGSRSWSGSRSRLPFTMTAISSISPTSAVEPAGSQPEGLEDEIASAGWEPRGRPPERGIRPRKSSSAR